MAILMYRDGATKLDNIPIRLGATGRSNPSKSYLAILALRT